MAGLRPGQNKKGPSMKLLVLRCNWRQCKSARTLALPADWTLGQLHAALQAAFGWDDSHLFAFTDRDRNTWTEHRGDADFADFFAGDQDPDKTKLFEVFRAPKDRLDYEYDFGDSNDVRIVFTKETEGDGPACLRATGLMAVEDSAGFGYADGIAYILKQGPSHRDYEDCVAWLQIFGPNPVETWIARQTADREAITARLAALCAPKPKRKRKF